MGAHKKDMKDTSSGKTKIRVKNVTQVYQENGRQTMALDDVSFDFIDRKFTAIVGPSGCGKSTLLSLVAGFRKPTKGEVLLDGVPVEKPGPDRGFVFQDYALFPWKTVLENVSFGLKLKGKTHEEANRTAREFLQMVNLQKFSDAYPYSLSGGMKQRVAIARALAYEPEVLLMDEPFGAVDAQTRKVLQKQLVHILENFKKTILFVTHSVLEAVYLSDVVVVMTAHPGKIKGVIDVDLPRPRDHSDMDYIAIRNKVLSLLEEEVEKEYQEKEMEPLSSS